MTIEQIQPLLTLDPWPVEDCIRRVNGMRPASSRTPCTGHIGTTMTPSSTTGFVSA